MRAVINPELQPVHLHRIHRAVMACRVTNLDTEELTVTLAVEEVSKGSFAPRTVTMKAADDDLLEAVLALEEGQMIVCFAGKRRPRSRRNDILYYAGGGKWYEARFVSDDEPSRWDLLADADEDVDPTSSRIMFATFNGRVESLWEMMVDFAAGRAYFPAVPFTRFRALRIDSFDEPLRGVALHDVNGDGRPDVLACSDGGNRLYVQRGRERFLDQTAAFGLAGTRSASCSFADADADGDPDLLLDGRIYLFADGRFEVAGRLPAEAGVDLLSSAFVEIDGDGWPDVVVSRRRGGFSVYLNPAANGGTFADRTEESGLRGEEGIRSGTGYFEAGDWDLDGRVDLIYLTGPGYLLLRGEDGRFESLMIGDEGEEHETGTAAFGGISRPDSPGAFLALGDQKMLLDNDGGDLADVTRFGNEILDPATGLLMCVAEDLNADGTLDLYAASRNRGEPSVFVTNRGYGSFMLEEKYRGGKIVPSTVYNDGAWGLAAGDATGDGANDLLVAGVNGQLTLLVNETLTDRRPEPEVGTVSDERKQIQTRIVTVRVAGATGVLGSRISLSDDRNRTVAVRRIGANIGVGCSGPRARSIAVREPGAYTVQIRFADGAVVRRALVLSGDSPRHQVLTLSRGPEGRETPFSKSSGRRARMRTATEQSQGRHIPPQ
jgi:hypothetical protein